MVYQAMRYWQLRPVHFQGGLAGTSLYYSPALDRLSLHHETSKGDLPENTNLFR